MWFGIWGLAFRVRGLCLWFGVRPSRYETPQPFELIELIEPFEQIQPQKPIVRVEYFQPLLSSSPQSTLLSMRFEN